MLKQLYINNFTLIDSLDINFESGFSVITGETGAGKSIILGAIGLLLGQRADIKYIKDNTKKCTIEAHFNIRDYNLSELFNSIDIEYDSEDCIIRRELTYSGKSRAFINDTPVQLSTLKEIGERLVDIHSQHQNFLINKHDFQLDIIDVIANNSLELSEYRKLYNNYIIKLEQLNKFEDELKKYNERADFITFQFEELNNANLKVGEQEELEQKQDTMSHAEEIKEILFKTEDILSSETYGIIKNIKQIITDLNSIKNIFPETNNITDRIDSNLIDLKDISYEISSLLNNIDFDPSELDAINLRLDKIYSLENKYHCKDINQLLNLYNSLKIQIEKNANSDIELEALKSEIEELKTECFKKANRISEIRAEAAIKIEKEMQCRLTKLGMPNVKFKIALENTTLGKNGCDNASFLFSANNDNVQKISQVASGGEIARIMLSLKAILNIHCKLPTIIFDEIDTGVSGKIAEMMAQIMQDMGSNKRQIICITHLPQIAARGKIHYKVFKESNNKSTTSKMVILNKEERINEIAQMLSGCDITEAAINNAKELLKL